MGIAFAAVSMLPVQSASRLNSPFSPLKQDTLLLDFVHGQEVIQVSFQDYY